MNINQDVALNSTIMCMKLTLGDLVDSAKIVLEQVQRRLENKVGVYLLIHNGNKKRKVEAQLNEIPRRLKETTKGVPFMTLFTLGEYGSNGQNPISVES